MPRFPTLIRDNIDSCRRLAHGVRLLGRLPLRDLFRLLSDWRRYQASNSMRSMRITMGSLWPVVDDFHAQAGHLSDYFHQDLWAARKIYKLQPSRHVDIGSRIDGFIAHLLVFMPVEYIDVRPLDAPVSNLTAVQSDAVSLGALEDDSVASISSLHAAEHFGLGRYSDPVDPAACFRFMRALSRVLAPGGRLYFSVPLGRERVEFNAHRIFALQTILSNFRALKLVSFSFVDHRDRLHEDVAHDGFRCSPEDCCGLFEFTKELSD